MTVTENRIARLKVVAVVVAFVLVGLGCGDGMGVTLGIEVTVNVTKDGDGSGSVVSSDIAGAENLDCGPICTIDFDDANGVGTFTLTATPDAGSVFARWSGDCTSTSGNVCTLSFDDNVDVLFGVTATFDVAPLTGPIVMELTWSSSGDLDVGGTTPSGGFISANFPGNDPNCDHTGDDLGNTMPLDFSEEMTCDPSEPGIYKIRIDNNATVGIEYTMTVTVGGVAPPGFPDTRTQPVGQFEYTFEVGS